MFLLLHGFARDVCLNSANSSSTVKTDDFEAKERASPPDRFSRVVIAHPTNTHGPTPGTPGTFCLHPARSTSPHRPKDIQKKKTWKVRVYLKKGFSGWLLQGTLREKVPRRVYDFNPSAHWQGSKEHWDGILIEHIQELEELWISK